jgi:hypothetical protein
MSGMIQGKSGNFAEVNSLDQLLTRTVQEQRPAYISRTLGKSFIASADDPDVAADEYIIWLQNNSDVPIVINSIFTFNVDANAIWKLHSVTGTGATAALVTPVNLNLSSGLDADVTCRGGAGGVTALSSVGEITTWAGGVAYFNTSGNWWLDALILGKNDAIAVEFDAGTGSRAGASIMFHDAV